MCRFTPQNWQPETTFQRVVTTACSPPHHVRFTDLWTRCSPFRWQAMPSLPSSSRAYLEAKEDLKKSEEELIQLLRGAEASHMTRREKRGADSGDASPVAEAHTPQRHPTEISLAKRRNAVSTPIRHIHRHLHRTPRRPATPVRYNIQPSPAVAVSVIC